MPEKTVVKAQPVNPPKEDGSDIDEMLYQFCFYYQQYTLQDAAELPFHQVVGLLQTAQQEKAREYLELTNISAAPHTKKGSGVKRLVTEYKGRVNG